MKKYTLYLLLAALTGLFASCSKDDTAAALQNDNPSNRVSIGASIDGALRTRAGEALTIPDNYKLRYVLEVYSSVDALVCKYEQTATDANFVNFDFTLTEAGTYTAVVWADFVNATAEETSVVASGGLNTYTHYADKHYKTTDNLQRVGIITTGYVINDESRDAFCGSETITKDVGALNASITLKRPFGQINVIEKNTGLLEKVANMTLTYNVPASFNVKTDAVTGSAEVMPTVNTSLPTATDDRKANLFYDFILAPATGQTTLEAIAMKFTSADDAVLLNDYTIPANMPVVRNKRTNISGSILHTSDVPSDATSLSVGISNGWEETIEEEEIPDIVWDGTYPTTAEQAKEWMGTETSGATSTTAAEHIFTITAARQLAALHYLIVNDVKLQNAVSEQPDPSPSGGMIVVPDNYGAATYNLAADIDLNNKSWTPIGYVSMSGAEYMTGTFNGQGHTVSGMNVSGALARGGLFCGVDGTVQYLNVKGNINTTSTSECGGIVAYLSRGKVAFCSFQGSITATRKHDGNDCYAGGIAGYIIGFSTAAEVISCYSVLSTISATNTGTAGAAKGGIGGRLREGTIKGCYWQEVTGLDNTNPYGDIFGDNNTTADNGHFTNAAGANSAVATMNNYATNYDYQWQAGGSDSEYPVLVKKQ